MPMISNHVTPTTNRDLLDTIKQFRSGRLDLLPCVNLLWVQAQGLEPPYKPYIGPIEDHLSDVEIIYALASESGQSVLDGVQAEQVEKALDDIVAMLTETR